MLDILETDHIDTVFTTANCTNNLQPLDLSLNKPAKDFVRWIWGVVRWIDMLTRTATLMTFTLHTMKLLEATWLEELDSYLIRHHDIQNGFHAIGITSTYYQHFKLWLCTITRNYWHCMLTMFSSLMLSKANAFLRMDRVLASNLATIHRRYCHNLSYKTETKSTTCMHCS